MKFNAEKSEVVSIGRSRSRSISDIVCLAGHRFNLLPIINYLGLPIGNDLKRTRALLLEFLDGKIRKACGLLVPCEEPYKRSVFSKIYNAFSVTHLLALSPF